MAQTAAKATTVDERMRRGSLKLKELGGTSEGIVERLKDIAPDLANYVIEFPAGEIVSRPGLDPKSRQIAAVAALTALGTAPNELRAQTNGALNMGCTRQEVVEVMIQCLIYAGFPAALGAIEVAREVFKERDEKGQKDS